MLKVLRNSVSFFLGKCGSLLNEMCLRSSIYCAKLWNSCTFSDIIFVVLSLCCIVCTYCDYFDTKAQKLNTQILYHSPRVYAKVYIQRYCLLNGFCSKSSMRPKRLNREKFLKQNSLSIESFFRFVIVRLLYKVYTVHWKQPETLYQPSSVWKVFTY